MPKSKDPSPKMSILGLSKLKVGNSRGNGGA